MSELNLILLGPPGAGKGTQAARLSDDFGLPYIGTGDLLRGHRSEGTELGRQAEEYMAAKAIALRATDRERGRDRGISMFVDEKRYRPGLEAYPRDGV